MPVPPLVRVPSPAEAARRIAPTEPETVAQRIKRILQTLPPTLQRRSFSEMFWKKVDESLNSTMSRIRVPPSLTRPNSKCRSCCPRKRGRELLTRALDKLISAAKPKMHSGLGSRRSENTDEGRNRKARLFQRLHAAKSQWRSVARQSLSACDACDPAKATRK